MENVTVGFIDDLYDFMSNGISAEVEEQARRCFIDYLGVVCSGCAINRSRIQSFLLEHPGNYTVYGWNHTVDFHTAVLVNAFHSHLLELDDGNRVAMTHLGAPIFSTLLAVAEKENRLLKDVFYGAVAGYEAAVRIGSAIQPSHKRKGFHVTGTCSTIGSAIGTAFMLGYDQTELSNVLSAAATSGAGLLEVITGKSCQKPYNIAHAAQAGLDAALFGKYFVGPDDILGGSRGFLRCFSDEFQEKMLFGNRDNPAIMRIYRKPYAACRHCHAPIEAALLLREEASVNISEIDQILVDTYDLAVYGHDHCQVEGVNSAKMSIPYGIATAFVYGNAGMEMFTLEKTKDPALQQIMDKVHVTAREELSALVPDKRVAIVKLVLKDGQTITKRVDYPKGEPENPMNLIDLQDKLLSLLAYTGFSKEYGNQILRLTENRERQVKEFLESLRGGQME